MAATITASMAGLTSSFVMIEFDENDRALDPIVQGAHLFDNQAKTKAELYRRPAATVGRKQSRTV
jgi:hypothetical protein